MFTEDKMMKYYRLLAKDLTSLIEEAGQASQKGGLEICGLLADNGYFIELIRCRNKSKRGGSFSFYQREVAVIERLIDILNHEIIGTFHSHPLAIAEPGDSDLENAFEEEFMLIIDVIGQKAALWHIKGKNKTKVDFELI